MRAKIIHNAQMFEAQISELKAKAPMYPEIHFEAKGGCIWATTMVKFTHDGTEYKRHFVDYDCGADAFINFVEKRLIHSVEESLKNAKPTECDEVVESENDMKAEILKVAQVLENGTIDSAKARSLLLGLFGVSSLQPLTVKRADKMMRELSKETWVALQGTDHGWKEWWADRNKLNLNREK